MISGEIRPCFDYRILEEYQNVLNRPKFPFISREIEWLLDQFVSVGLEVLAPPAVEPCVDPDDTKFLEVAAYLQVPLVTGNIRHFPPDPLVMDVHSFKVYLGERGNHGIEHGL